jgi:hypothetical protein
MSSPTTICVYDNFTASEASVTLWATNDEETGRLNLEGWLVILYIRHLHVAYVILGLAVKEVSWNNLLDDLLQNFLAQFLSCDSFAVLGADDNGIDTPGDDSTTIV